MSVFGGDSWAREAHHRKRRVDDLLLSSSSSPSTDGASYKKLCNGKFACLVCHHNPVLDSPLMLSIHMKGFRHIVAEAKLKEKELSRKEEINKRIAVSGDIKEFSSSTCSFSNSEGSAIKTKPQNKPLIEKTRQVLLETHCERIRGHNIKNGRNPAITTALTTFNSHHNCLLSDHQSQQNQQTGSVVPVNYIENVSERISSVDYNVNSEWYTERQKRHEKELQFTAAGWKRDGRGKWYKDENAEFDSDEDDPNVFFSQS